MKTSLTLLAALALLAGCALKPHLPPRPWSEPATPIEVGSLWRFRSLTREEYHQPINLFKVTTVTTDSVGAQRVQRETAPTLWLSRAQFLADFEPR
jgi:hypothetical protein